jgi:RecA-family ATPase
MKATNGPSNTDQKNPTAGRQTGAGSTKGDEMQDEHTMTDIEISTPTTQEPDDLHGIDETDNYPRQPFNEIVKDFLSRCRRTRWVREDSPLASELSRQISDWAGVFPNVAAPVIAAAEELGFICVHKDGYNLSGCPRDALIGVSRDDIAARIAERVKSPEPVQEPEEEDFFKRYFREKGFRLPGDVERIEFMNLSEPPPPREYAVPDRIPLRQVTLFSGEGGIGKSILTLQLLCSTVLAHDWLGVQPLPGPVIYLGAEDEQDEIHRRLDDIAEHYGVSRSELIDNGLYASSYAGKNMTLARFDSDGDIEYTPLFRGLWEKACEVRPTIIVLDTLSDIFDGDENNRGQVSAFMVLLRSLAMAANCAVVVNQHPSQAGTNSGSGTSGSTAWHGKARGRMWLRAASKDEGGGLTDPELLTLQFMKNQYGARAPNVLLRYQNGVFVPEMPGGSLDRQVAEQNAEQVFLTLLDRFTSQGRNVSDKKGTTYAPACFAKEREATSQRLSKAALADAMLRLFGSGTIRVATEGPKSKLRSRIVKA